MRVTAWERRQMATICRAILPQKGETFLPGAEELPLEAFVDEFFAYTPGGSSIGVRLATIIILVAALFRYGRSFGRLTREKQADLLNTMASSRWYIVREMPMLVKLMAFLAWDGDPRVHRALGVRMHDGSSPDWLVEAKR